MRVDIESGKYTYIFEDGRARLLRYGEPTSRDVVGDKLIYCMAAEISELRQQLADRDEQISDLTISSDTYFAERNSARDVWRRASKDRDELRQQLAAALAACKQKNRAIEEAMGWNWLDGDEEIPEEVVEMIAQAMAAQPNDSALKAWLGEPVVWQFSDNYGTHYTDDRREWYDAVGIESVMPLYAPKGMK